MKDEKGTMGFYDDLKASRPERIQDLWPTTSDWWQHKGRQFGQFDGCTLAEHLDVWASDEEMDGLIHDAAVLRSLVDSCADASDRSSWCWASFARIGRRRVPEIVHQWRTKWSSW